MTEKRRDSLFLDVDRLRRCGHPEVVYAPGKTLEQITAALEILHRAHGVALATRVSRENGHAAVEMLNGIEYNEDAGTLRLGNPMKLSTMRNVAVISAGTSDSRVAEECAVVLETFGVAATRFPDVGVAGLHRLLGVVEEVLHCDIAVVVAGMEGALPSVVAGLVDIPVIAVPTSTGYGVGAGGTTALHGMLSSCAAGVTVVNIDNGFGAAMGVIRMLALDRGKGNSESEENETQD